MANIIEFTDDVFGFSVVGFLSTEATLWTHLVNGIY